MAKQTEWKTETYGGVLNFLATAYIPAVHAAILTQAGLPFEGALVGAILTSIIGTLIADSSICRFSCYREWGLMRSSRTRSSYRWD